MFSWEKVAFDVAYTFFGEVYQFSVIGYYNLLGWAQAKLLCKLFLHGCKNSLEEPQFLLWLLWKMIYEWRIRVGKTYNLIREKVIGKKDGHVGKPLTSKRDCSIKAKTNNQYSFDDDGWIFY